MQLEPKELHRTAQAPDVKRYEWSQVYSKCHTGALPMVLKIIGWLGFGFVAFSVLTGMRFDGLVMVCYVLSGLLWLLLFLAAGSIVDALRATQAIQYSMLVIMQDDEDALGKKKG